MHWRLNNYYLQTLTCLDDQIMNDDAVEVFKKIDRIGDNLVPFREFQGSIDFLLEQYKLLDSLDMKYQLGLGLEGEKLFYDALSEVFLINYNAETPITGNLDFGVASISQERLLDDDQIIMRWCDVQKEVNFTALIYSWSSKGLSV